MSKEILVADVGGTNARLALCDITTGKITNQSTFSTLSYSSLEITVAYYLSQVESKISKACIAIACPVDGDIVKMTNHNWSFSIQEMKENLNFDVLEVINDFHAIAMAIPFVSPDEKVAIANFSVDETKPITIVGAGTGLGVAHLFPYKNEWISLPGEGGHVEFSACNDQEYAILKILKKRFGRVSVERVLSGPGLVNLYQAYVESQNRTPAELSAEKISTLAISNQCNDCYATLTLFCTILGRFSGSLALTFNSQGGVYIAGGIVPRFIKFLIQSDFMKAFTEKGRFKKYVGEVPVFVLTHSQSGLMGAGAYLRQKMGIPLKN